MKDILEVNRTVHMLYSSLDFPWLISNGNMTSEDDGLLGIVKREIFFLSSDNNYEYSSRLINMNAGCSQTIKL